METGTVILKVEEYNRLRDLKNEIEKGNTLMVRGYGWHHDSNILFVSESEAVKEVAKKNAELVDEISKLEKSQEKKQQPIEPRYKIGELSFFEFIKLKYFK